VEHPYLQLKLTELGRQEYAGNNAVFSAGLVEGHPIDTVYLRLERDGEEPTTILLRPDEMAAIAWLCSGVLWSLEMSRLLGGKDGEPTGNSAGG
jgi:hypothetical protein